jgi:uncharacterized Ntn-hydrolase superfamily protein
MRLLIPALLLLSLGALAQEHPSTPTVATYSIVAWDSLTGDLGVAVQSKFLGVGAVVPYAKAGVGAVATQAWANTTYGPRALEMLGRGMSAQQAGELLTATDSGASKRQLGIVDSRGGVYYYTGIGCMPYAGHIGGRGYSVQGNILAGESVLKAMARMFELTDGDLADRLLAALDAAEREGGDRRGRQSAALLVVRDQGGYGGFNDRFVDIRVDDDSLPLVELHRVYGLWKSEFLPEARMRTVDAFTAAKNYRAAQAELQRLVGALNAELRMKPDDIDVLRRIAWTLATHEIDKDRALELAKRAATLAPTRSDILDTMAECHYRLGHFDEAIAIEANLVTKEPANDDYWKQLQKFKDARQRSGR